MATKGTKKELKKRLSLSKSYLIIIALAFGLIGGYAIYRSFAAGGTSTANIWVDSNGGSCGRSASQASYVDASACGSLSAAVAIASPGDVVGWKGGTYGGQTIASNNSLRNLSPACDPYGQWGAASSTNCVRIEPATGESIIVNGNIEDHAASVWINGTATGLITSPKARTFNITVNGYVDTEADSESVFPEHVTMEGIDTLMLGTFSSTNVYLRNIDVGPATLGTNCVAVESQGGTFEDAVGYGSGIAVVPTNVVYDGIYIHNQTRNAAGGVSDCHDGGLFLKCTTGFTLENSVFSQNAVYDVQEQDVGCGFQSSGVTMQNNWFGCPVDFQDQDGGNGSNVCDGQSDVQFNASGTYANHLYRFNSLEDGFGCSGLNCAFSNVRFIGNATSVSTNQVCGVTGTTWAYNAMVGTSGGRTTCGATDVSLSSTNNLSLLFQSISIGAEDFHLLNSTNAANNLVTPTTSDYSLSTDIDGDSRAAPRDAGADEFGGSGGGGTTPTVSLNASPSTIASGDSSTLNWSSANVTSCTASGAWSGSKATSGSQSTGALSSNTTYTLTCTGTNGSANASATVTIGSSSGPPTITSFSPTSGPIGTRVTITGTNLDQTTVLQFFQGGTVNYTINSSTQIQATVPSGTQTGNFSLNFGQATSPQVFTVTSSKVGDINSDGAVNILDFSIFLSDWGTSAGSADFNSDGTVNILDFSIFLNNYGT